MSEPLGSITKFASTSSRAMRFYAQSLARELLPDHRIKICWRYRLPDTPTVDIYHSQSRGRSHVRGLMHCGSGWVCAVCAAYITEQRRAELSLALDRARENYIYLMVTYTISHDPKDSLRDTLDTLQSSYRALRSGRWWQAFKNLYDVVGSVRATEITFGKNGWHPHYHEIMFFRRFAERDGFPVGDVGILGAEIEHSLGGRWQHVVTSRGRSVKSGVGINVATANDRVNEYVAKWGKMPAESEAWTTAHEVAKAQYKRASFGGLTPMQLLFAYGAGDKRAGHLFREYARATKGRSALHWARGTRAMLDIEVISDEIASAGLTDDEILLASLTPDQWRAVKRVDAIAAVMAAADTGDASAVKQVVSEAMAQCEPRGTLRVVCAPCGAEMTRHDDPTGGSVYICPKCGQETHKS